MGKVWPAVTGWLLIGVLMLGASGPGWAEEDAPRDPEGELAVTLSHYGRWMPLYATPGLALLGDARGERAGRQAADAIIVTSTATALLKHYVRSGRPTNPDMHHGFPSGHTSLNFAFARSLAAEYPRLAVPAYAFAAAVGWSRVRGKSHTIIQVVGGAALGWYLADRSVHSDGGLLNGLVVEKRNGTAPAGGRASGGAGAEVWRASW